MRVTHILAVLLAPTSAATVVQTKSGGHCCLCRDGEPVRVPWLGFTCNIPGGNCHAVHLGGDCKKHALVDLVKEEYINKCGRLQGAGGYNDRAKILTKDDLANIKWAKLGSAMKAVGLHGDVVESLAEWLVKDPEVQTMRKNAKNVQIKGAMENSNGAIENWFEALVDGSWDNPDDKVQRQMVWVWFHRDFCTYYEKERCGEIPESACVLSKEKAVKYCGKGSTIKACGDLVKAGEVDWAELNLPKGVEQKELSEERKLEIERETAEHNADFEA